VVQSPDDAHPRSAIRPFSPWKACLYGQSAIVVRLRPHPPHLQPCRLQLSSQSKRRSSFFQQHTPYSLPAPTFFASSREAIVHSSMIKGHAQFLFFEKETLREPATGTWPHRASMRAAVRSPGHDGFCQGQFNSSQYLQHLPHEPRSHCPAVWVIRIRSSSPLDPITGWCGGRPGLISNVLVLPRWVEDRGC
jgi:hypothetical protein